MAPHIPPIEAAAAARVTLVLGANDAGKTTLVTGLASALASRGFVVGVVDADLGQSDVGPPTTVGLGRVRRPIASLQEAEVLGLEFLGMTSPARCMRETGDATARLTARALEAGCERVLVDTSGLVEGDFGRALKRIKIDRVRPDLLIALQRGEECEPILRLYEGSTAVLRMPAGAAKRRSPAERRRRRQRALDAHLAGAVPLALDLTRVAARPAPATRGLAVIELLGTLVGLDDRDGRTRGLGWVSALDPGKARLTVETAVAGKGIAAVATGRERYRVA